MKKLQKFENSDKLCQYISELSEGKVALAFSCGKDAIGSWIQLNRYFKDIRMYYMEVIPGIQFVKDSLKYYEDVFKKEILVIEHPWFNNALSESIYQSPDTWMQFDGIKKINRQDVIDSAKKSLFGTKNVYMAAGVRSSDSTIRNLVFKKNGVAYHDMRNKRFYPIYDWSNSRLLDEIRKSKIKLPPDYKMIGRSFESLTTDLITPIRNFYPRDYEIILKWFPLFEADEFRRKI